MELKKKVNLDKRGDSYSIPLLKKGEQRDIICNLNWSQFTAKSGFFSRIFSKGIDLDLGVFFELTNGQTGLIDGLQFAHGQGGTRSQISKQGSYDHSPWVWHAGDDRTGSSNAGEFIYVNPKGLKDIKRLQFYATIHNSDVSWAETNAEISVNIPGHPHVTINLNSEFNTKSLCLFCTIKFTSIGIEVSNQTSFHNGRPDADKQYDWGFTYREGTK